MNATECILRMFYPTSDDWSPNFPRDTVEIAMYRYPIALNQKTRMIRILVCGADDTAMERDERIPIEDWLKRETELLRWVRNDLPNPLTQEWLLKQGFCWA